MIGRPWLTLSLGFAFCLAASGLFAQQTAEPKSPAAATGPKAEPPTAIPTLPQVAKISEQVRKVWTENGLKPSGYASDSEWCRRLFLDLLGRIPSYAEMNAFVASKSANKRAELVEKLLNSDTYTEEFARNWTTNWTNILIGRSAGTERNSPVNRVGMQKFLRDSLARNKPYDQFVFELVSATGSNRPGDADFNGAVNFYTGKLEEKAAQATADTAKIFLGMQVQCTQCHNHPFNEWKQRKFWEMNAYFRQTRGLREFKAGTNNIDTVTLANEDFGGEGSGNAEKAEIYYELRNGKLEVAYPTFVDGTPINPSGYLSDVNRRAELAKQITNSPYMGEAFVNRMWAHFLGYGFTKPIDDMGPHNVPTHPELLTYLGQQFKDNSFNPKEVMRWIVLSEPYALSSRGSGAKGDDPLIGETPKFSRFYLRQMSAEQLYESLLVATQAHKTRGTPEEQEETKSKWLQQFVTAFGTDEGDESTSFNGTIPQALMMMNGELIQKATDASPGSFLSTLASSNLRPGQQIEYLFMAALARRPNSAELSAANALVGARQGNTTAALQDIWWAVLNSNEFIINH